ncbi:hypothetical protein MMC11_005325 [Xylographa trunciseda]|nr:hypothetical protein [Xylographa trunciseda]
MLERATGCLKDGGRRLLRLNSRSIRTRRSLHSAFWCHGAGDIDLPSWWISLLQQPPPEKITHSQSIVDTAKNCLSAGLLDGGFLDFLYPAKTLSLIHKLAIRDVKQVSHRSYRPSKQAAIRLYTSEAVEDRVATDSDLDHATSLLSTIRENHLPRAAQEALTLEKGQTTTKDTLKSGQSLANTRTDCKESIAEYDQAWQRYSELEAEADMPEETLIAMLKHIEQLCLKLRAETSRQTLDTFAMVPVEARSADHYVWAFRASLILRDVDSAMRILFEAQERSMESIRSTKILMRYIVQHENIEAGAKLLTTWEKSEFCADFNIFEDLNVIKPDILVKKGIRIGQEALDKFSSKSSDIDTSIRNFAIKFILESLEKPGSTELRRHPASLKVLLRLIRLSPELSTFTINRLLSSNTLVLDLQAVMIYEDVRDRTDIVQPKMLMQHLISHLSSVHDDRHLRMVFEDYRKHYGLPSPELFALTIREMSRQGDATAFHSLFQEYRDNFGNPTDPSMYQQLLHVHSRRLEVKEVIENFNSLQKVFGFVPNVDCWNTVIAAHARLSDTDGALKWYKKLLESEVKPDANTISTLISMYASGGDVDAIENLIQDCTQRGLQLSTSMIDGLVLAYIRNGDLEEAEKIVSGALKMDLTGSRTHMWNYILNGAALQRDLSKLNYLHQCMEEADIPSDAMTYGSLMQGLCVHGLPQSAERILYNVMRRKGIRATAFHYAVVMGGFLNVGSYQKMFDTYQKMLKNDITPNFSAQKLLLKAATYLDVEDHKAQSLGSAEAIHYRRAEELLAQAIVSVDASDIALPEPIKGIGVQRLDEALTSSLFEYLIYLNAQNGAVDKVPALYAQYLETSKRLRPNAPIDLPIKMLTSLMVSHLKLKQHEEVEKCWYLALQSAEPLARRVGASLAEPGWVLPGRRLILNLPLMHYMKSLLYQDRTDDIPDVVAELRTAGYALSNKAWNLYVQALAMGGQPRLAFQAAEKELMDSWEGWPQARGVDKPPNRGRMPSRLRSHLKPTRTFPNYRTLVQLTQAYMDMRNRYAFAGPRNPLQKLHVEAPRAVQAVVDMPQWIQKSAFKGGTLWDRSVK